MKKCLLIFPFLILAFFAFSQHVFIQGRIINDGDNTAVASAKIIRMDSLSDVSSDKKGFFKIQIPSEGKTVLLFSHPDFVLQTMELNPAAIKAPILVNLVPSKTDKPSSLVLNYKNTLAIAPVELLFFGLTFEYERRLNLNHAVGSYATALLNQGIWMFNATSSGVTLKGFKAEPFYRYYVRNNEKDIGFAQIKISYANFTINDHHYADPTVVTPAQGFGIGLAWGWKIMHSKFPRHSIEIVTGAKFVPFITEDENLNDLIKNYRREYWWNVVGPGAVFDIKFTLGGIF